MERVFSQSGNDLPNSVNSTSISRVVKQSGRPLLNHRQQHHLPRGDDRERITSARQAAEALFTPKPQSVALSASDPAPSAEQRARKPRRAAGLVAGTGPQRGSCGTGQPRAPAHASGPAVAPRPHPFRRRLRRSGPPRTRAVRIRPGRTVANRTVAARAAAVSPSHAGPPSARQRHRRTVR